MIDWTTIITAIIGVVSGGFLVTIYELIKYRKQNKTLKDNEATNSTSETQSNQIDLGKKYIQEMLETMELVKQYTQQGNVNQTEMIRRMGLLDQRLDSVEITLSNLVEWADGPYNQFLADKAKGMVKPRKTIHKKKEVKENE